MKTPEQNRRYLCHQRLKARGIKYKPLEKTIYLADRSKAPKWAVELQEKFNYSIQLEIA